ncbi:MAG: hypothetical protein ACTSSE_16665 [Candidatus Thorarchaeota archaeon]
MGKTAFMILVGLIGLLAFWVYDITNAFIMSFFTAGGSIHPVLAFVIGIIIFLGDLWVIGWIFLKVPGVANKIKL